MQVGVLNKRQGFNFFKKIEVGTPVYEQGGYYYLWQEHESGKYCEMVRYYKENLSPIIDFIHNG